MGTSITIPEDLEQRLNKKVIRQKQPTGTNKLNKPKTNTYYYRQEQFIKEVDTYSLNLAHKNKIQNNVGQNNSNKENTDRIIGSEVIKYCRREVENNLNIQKEEQQIQLQMNSENNKDKKKQNKYKEGQSKVWRKQLNQQLSIFSNLTKEEIQHFKGTSAKIEQSINAKIGESINSNNVALQTIKINQIKINQSINNISRFTNQSNQQQTLSINSIYKSTPKQKKQSQNNNCKTHRLNAEDLSLRAKQNNQQVSKMAKIIKTYPKLKQIFVEEEIQVDRKIVKINLY